MDMEEVNMYVISFIPLLNETDLGNVGNYKLFLHFS